MGVKNKVVGGVFMGIFGNKEKRVEQKKIRDAKKSMESEMFEHFKNDNDLRLGDIFFDDKNQQFLVKKSILSLREQQVFDYSELVGCTPIFVGSKIKKHHGITRAVVGGVLAGPVGALVGAGTGGKQFESVKQLGVMLHFSDNSTLKYMLITTETKLDSFVGKTNMDLYNKLVNKLEQIISAAVSPENTSNENVPDEIRKYKNLLDDGIITQEEFDAKKKELLGL